MAYLYQRIKDVPGLSGSSFQRQKQLYERLGSPKGPYRGSYNQNIWLLNQIKRGNFGTQKKNRRPAPKPKPKRNTQPSKGKNVAEKYADAVGANDVYQGPVFGEVLPFYEAWEQMRPAVTAEAEAQVNPFIERAVNRETTQFNRELARSGGGRFAGSRSELGNVQADLERQRRSQIMDWQNQRQQGFRELFYNPAERAFNRQIELGQTPGEVKIPTWDEFTKNYQGNQPQITGPTFNTA